MVKLQPFVSRGDFLGWLNADFGIPFSRWKDNHLIQKLIYAGNEVLAISGLVGYITEELGAGDGDKGRGFHYISWLTVYHGDRDKYVARITGI